MSNIMNPMQAPYALGANLGNAMAVGADIKGKRLENQMVQGQMDDQADMKKLGGAFSDYSQRLNDPNLTEEQRAAYTAGQDAAFGGMVTIDPTEAKAFMESYQTLPEERRKEVQRANQKMGTLAFAILNAKDPNATWTKVRGNLTPEQLKTSGMPEEYNEAWAVQRITMAAEYDDMFKMWGDKELSAQSFEQQQNLQWDSQIWQANLSDKQFDQEILKLKDQQGFTLNQMSDEQIYKMEQLDYDRQTQIILALMKNDSALDIAAYNNSAGQKWKNSDEKIVNTLVKQTMGASVDPETGEWIYRDPDTGKIVPFDAVSGQKIIPVVEEAIKQYKSGKAESIAQAVANAFASQDLTLLGETRQKIEQYNRTKKGTTTYDLTKPSGGASAQQISQPSKP